MNQEGDFTTAKINTEKVTPEMRTNVSKRRMSFIWGFLAMGLGIAGLLVGNTWASATLLILALILGIICISKKSRLYGFAIAAIVFVIIGFLFYAIAYNSMKKGKTVIDEIHSESSVIESNETSEKKEVPVGVDPELVEFLSICG